MRILGPCRAVSRDFWMTIFLTSSWTFHFSVFGVNLAPSWLPTWLQNRPKIGPRAIQNPSQLASCFPSPFGCDFYRFLMDFRPPNQPNIKGKSINKSHQQHNNKKTKMFKNHWFLQYIRVLDDVTERATIHKKRPSIFQKIALKSMLQLGSILEPTWLHFGRVLGAKREPSWLQMVSKIDP